MGEFEKRIKEKVDSGLDAVNETIWRKFMEIVEEAKKEFPETCILEILKPIVSDEVLEKVKVELYKYPQWYEKWLS